MSGYDTSSVPVAGSAVYLTHETLPFSARDDEYDFVKSMSSETYGINEQFSPSPSRKARRGSYCSEGRTEIESVAPVRG